MKTAYLIQLQDLRWIHTGNPDATPTGQAARYSHATSEDARNAAALQWCGPEELTFEARPFVPPTYLHRGVTITASYDSGNTSHRCKSIQGYTYFGSSYSSLHGWSKTLKGAKADIARFIDKYNDGTLRDCRAKELRDYVPAAKLANPRPIPPTPHNFPTPPTLRESVEAFFIEVDKPGMGAVARYRAMERLRKAANLSR